MHPDAVDFPDIVQVERFDLEAILETLENNKDFFMFRDEMNSRIHLEKVRISPITEKTIMTVDLLKKILE